MNGRPQPVNGRLVIWPGRPQIARMAALLVTFLLGIVNFAVHQAVLESGHPLLGRMPQDVRYFGRPFGRPQPCVVRDDATLSLY